tara:strand:- start:623 stop:907 length:285 start_codon:yes stop_codon:yes gene_type:complete
MVEISQIHCNEHTIINNDSVNTITYYNSHKYEILKQKKKYYELNKNKLLKKVNCNCGAIIAHAAYKRHLKSKKHLKFVDNTELEPISEELTSEE